jgi:hypothetical protein
MSQAVITKIWRQPIKIEVIQSLNVVITTRVETMVAPNTNIVRSGVLIGFAANLGSGSSGVLAGRNLSWSSTLSTTTRDTLDAIYQSDNDYSCEHDYKSTTNELNGC